LLRVCRRPRQQQPTFSTRTESVRLDVLVTDGGRIVNGLGPDDFEIRDEGVPQTVDLVHFQQLPLHIVLALDLSYSVSGERLDDLRGASHTLLDALTAKDHASLLTFTHAVSRRSAPTANVATLAQSSIPSRPKASMDRAGLRSVTRPTHRSLPRTRLTGDPSRSSSATASTLEAG
jgi:hypothetical protein